MQQQQQQQGGGEETPATMEITMGMEFQTPDGNLMLYHPVQNAAYYVAGRKSFVMPMMRDDKRDRKDECKISVTGDLVTSHRVKQYLQHMPIHGKGEEIILQLKTGKENRKFRIGGSSLENIYNDAEFDVLLTSPLCIAPDRASILRGIHEAIVKGASCLQETLQTYVSVPPMTIVSSTLSNISNESTEKDIKLPYRKLFQIHDEEKKGTLYCMLSTRPTLKSFSYFTQVTMGIPFPHVLTVLRVITKELLDHKDTNGLRHEDEEQLKILPEAEREVEDVLPGSDPLHDLTVLVVYWLKTRPHRKASPFLIRHHMVQLLKTMLTMEEKERLLEIVTTINMSYREVIKTLLTSHYNSATKLYFRQLQNTNKSTLFQVESRPASLLIEIRFVYALLNHWLRSVESLYTLTSLCEMPPLSSRPSRHTTRKRHL
jgi:hypothetical protein